MELAPLLRLPSIPRAATPHAWRGRRWCASRSPTAGDEQALGAHRPTVANGVGDAGTIDCCLGPHLRPRLHAALLPGSARAHLASASRPAARRPFNPAAAPLTLLPRNRPQAIASMRARRLRRNSRARAPRAGPIGERRALAAVPRDPVRSPPRGCHAAGRPRRIGRRIGQLFRRQRFGYSVGRCLVSQAWPIGRVAQRRVLWTASLSARAPLSVGRAC